MRLVEKMKEDSLKKVSLVVITLDEEEQLRRCLSSAEGVGEIIVVDSFSSDGTVGVAEEFGAKIYRREYVSAADQKNWAIGKAMGEWILILDADEALSPELKSEIAKELAKPSAEGYWLKRRSEFLGKRIRHCGWGRDKVLRLFKRGKGRYPDRMIHEKLAFEGSSITLEGYIEHRPYRSLSQYLDKLKSYSYRGALQGKREGKWWFPQIVVNPFFRFIRMYIFQLGFLDGILGFVLCVLGSFSVFMKYAMLLELKLGMKKRLD